MCKEFNLGGNKIFISDKALKYDFPNAIAELSKVLN